jgi:hypothetical protein
MRHCTRCNSITVKPMEPSGLFEFIILPDFLLRPFRCLACRHRQLRFCLPLAGSVILPT